MFSGKERLPSQIHVGDMNRDVQQGQIGRKLFLQNHVTLHQTGTSINIKILHFQATLIHVLSMKGIIKANVFLFQSWIYW